MKSIDSAAMAGKTCVVTGSTSGIGRATALGLAELGARVVIVARSAERGRETAAEVLASGGPEPDVIVADLSSQAEVRELAAAIIGRHPRLDVLVNNAAVIPRERTLTADGIEMQLAVNHLAPFLLTRLLLDRLKASAPARVVVVASQVESAGRIRLDDLGFERGYDRLEAYSQSKLANVLFTYELARRLEGTGVTANCLHPGVIATKLLDDYIGRPRALRFVTRLRNPPPREGAKLSIHLAASPELEGVTGKYFTGGKEAVSSPQSRDPALAKALWEASERLV